VIEIDDALRDDLPRIAEIMKKYRDLPANLADASLVARGERRAIKTVASTNADFDVYRLPRGKSFKNVFLGA
jgi:uncharacterized protein